MNMEEITRAVLLADYEIITSMVKSLKDKLGEYDEDQILYANNVKAKILTELGERELAKK